MASLCHSRTLNLLHSNQGKLLKNKIPLQIPPNLLPKAYKTIRIPTHGSFWCGLFYPLTHHALVIIASVQFGNHILLQLKKNTPLWSTSQRPHKTKFPTTSSSYPISIPHSFDLHHSFLHSNYECLIL